MAVRRQERQDERPGSGPVGQVGRGAGERGFRVQEVSFVVSHLKDERCVAHFFFMLATKASCAFCISSRLRSFMC
jgi:hypothetical protein